MATVAMGASAPPGQSLAMVEQAGLAMPRIRLALLAARVVTRASPSLAVRVVRRAVALARQARPDPMVRAGSMPLSAAMAAPVAEVTMQRLILRLRRARQVAMAAPAARPVRLVTVVMAARAAVVRLAMR